MSIFSLLPFELWREIAADSEPAYKAIVCSFVEFTRKLTPADVQQFKESFGHTHKVLYIGNRVSMRVWKRHGFLHRLDGPALITDTFTAWYKAGEFHCETEPAVNDILRGQKNMV